MLLILFAETLCGCGLNEKPVTLDSSMEIPEDGIISASVFERLQKENKVITFFGQSKDTYYEWTVFGNDVVTPQDTNMKLDVTKDEDGRIDFSLCTESEFSFPSVLSLHSSWLWTTDNALVYYNDGGTMNPISSASVTGSKTSVLNFSLTQPGQYSVLAETAADGEKQAASPAEERESESENERADMIQETDPYLSAADGGGGRVLSDGRQTGQDAYLTDPVPEGKPMPVEPENQNVDEKKSYTCTFSIGCSTILNNLGDLNPDKLDTVPSNGVIYSMQTVTFYEGESVYDVLQRICKENGIHMEASWTPIYNSAYVEGIHNLYEFDCGTGSGWMYRVNGWYPNYGCSRYQLAQGDIVEWRYTCDLGADIGGGYAIGG